VKNTVSSFNSLLKPLFSFLSTILNKLKNPKLVYPTMDDLGSTFSTLGELFSDKEFQEETHDWIIKNSSEFEKIIKVATNSLTHYLGILESVESITKVKFTPYKISTVSELQFGLRWLSLKKKLKKFL